MPPTPEALVGPGERFDNNIACYLSSASVEPGPGAAPRVLSLAPTQQRMSCHDASASTHHQLVRNVLAACVRPDGAVAPENGHVVVIYDERNPAFQPGGDALHGYDQTNRALRVPRLLRKCGWQRIVRHLRKEAVLPWLTEHLELKYGLV